jgi:drug/metabolite transporter (DMT)-like permease
MADPVQQMQQRTEKMLRIMMIITEMLFLGGSVYLSRTLLEMQSRLMLAGAVVAVTLCSPLILRLALKSMHDIHQQVALKGWQGVERRKMNRSERLEMWKFVLLSFGVMAILSFIAVYPSTWTNGASDRHILYGLWTVNVLLVVMHIARAVRLYSADVSS